MTDQIEAWKLEAFNRGAEAAKAAASWCTDGNTSSEHYARMIVMFDDGDPRLSDYLPTMPDLSGEWADAPTPRSLYEDVTGRDEDGVGETFEPECERLIRAQVAA